MPCESCGVQFSVFRVRRGCVECARWYCVACLRRGGGMCAPCRLLSARPLLQPDIAHLRVRDLQCFLQRQNVSTRGCVEKEELLNLCVLHVNSASYRRRARPAPSGAFCALKGLTSNINRLINSAFEPRPQPAPPPPPPPNRAPAQRGGDCYNSSHAHARSPPARAPHPVHPAASPPLPGWREYIPADSARPPSPPGARSPADEDGADSAGSAGAERVDTADCFEVEDLDDGGWEFVTRPADPLPTDSEVLLDPVPPAPPAPAARSPPPRSPPRAAAPHTPARAASELDLRRSPSLQRDPDTASLQDEAFLEVEPEPGVPRRVTLDDVQSAAQLEALSIRQLKELLSDNRVEFRGCLERADLLQRAAALWRDHVRCREQLESLPLEECCKICMAAPLECVLLECGHLATCTACGKRLAECPICRRYVVRAVRVFRS